MTPNSAPNSVPIATATNNSDGNNDASARARALLGSLKEQREFFQAKRMAVPHRTTTTSTSDGDSRTSTSNNNKNDNPDDKYIIHKPQDEKATPSQLDLVQHDMGLLLQERKHLLSRLTLSPSCHTANTHSTCDETQTSEEDWSSSHNHYVVTVHHDQNDNQNDAQDQDTKQQQQQPTVQSLGSIQSFSSKEDEDEGGDPVLDARKSPVVLNRALSKNAKTTTTLFTPVMEEESSQHSRTLAWIPRTENKESTEPTKQDKKENKESTEPTKQDKKEEFKDKSEASPLWVPTTATVAPVVPQPSKPSSLEHKNSNNSWDIPRSLMAPSLQTTTTITTTTTTKATTNDSSSDASAAPVRTASSTTATTKQQQPPLQANFDAAQRRGLYIDKLYSPFRMVPPTVEERCKPPPPPPMVLLDPVPELTVTDSSDDEEEEEESPLRRITGMDLVQSPKNQHPHFVEDLKLLQGRRRHRSTSVDRSIQSDTSSSHANKNETDDSILISDESSFECSSTADSNTSGWVSEREQLLNDDSFLMHDDSFLLSEDEEKETRKEKRKQKHKAPQQKPVLLQGSGHRFQRDLAPASLVARRPGAQHHDAMPVPEVIISTKVRRFGPPIVYRHLLFVPPGLAEFVSHSHGGLYCMALATGLVERIPRPIVRATTATQPMLCLSTDFRCGAQGSLYHIAMESNCPVHQPLTLAEHEQWLAKKKKPKRTKKLKVPKHGGLYYIARQSGLSQADLDSKQGYTLFIKTSASANRPVLVPERMADRDCGGLGNLYVCLESGISLCPSPGTSMKHLSRTGFRF